MIWLPYTWELAIYRQLAPEQPFGISLLGILANGFTWIWLPVLLGIPLVRGPWLPWISRLIWVQAFFTIPYQLTGIVGALLRRPSAAMLSDEYGLLSPVYHLGQTTDCPDPFITGCCSMLVLVWNGQQNWLRLLSVVVVFLICCFRVSGGVSWPMDIALALALGTFLGFVLRLGYRGTERILLTEGIA